MVADTLVVDSSVVIKWVLNEEGRPKAMRLLELYQDEHVTLMAPRLVLYEAGNVLWKSVRSGRLSREEATRAFGYVLENAPVLTDSGQVSESALQLALAHDRTVYDCLYLSLALYRQCELVTADEKFFRAVRLAFPFVRLLRNC